PLIFVHLITPRILWEVKRATPICRKKILRPLIKIIFFVSLLISTGAQGQTLRSFCFDRSVSLLQAKSYLRDILAPSDQLTENRQLNCLEVMIEDKRSDLVFQYLKRRYPKVEVLGGNHHSPSL